MTAFRQFVLLSLTATALALAPDAHAFGKKEPKTEPVKEEPKEEVKANAAAQTATQPALLVAKTVSVQMLKTFTMGMISTSSEYMQAVKTMGKKEADFKRDGVLDETIPQYLPEWENTLALAYEKKMTQQEMLDLMKPDTPVELKQKFAKTHNEVMKELLPSSQTMLAKLANDVSTKAFSKSAPNSPRGGK